MTKNTILVAVKSCKRDVDMGCHQAIRDTWGKYIGGRADLRFFVGGTTSVSQPDETRVDAPDAYKALSLKVNEILRWVLAHEYEYVVLVDTDTFIVPDRLFELPWGTFDYTGMYLTWEGGFMFGGVGFALSARAAKLIVDSPIQDGMDDISIGNILIPNSDMRKGSTIWHRRIGWHFPKNIYSMKTYDPRFPWMKLMTQKHINNNLTAYYIWDTVIGGAHRRVLISLSGEDRESL
jgi:hypothetical protein